MNIPLKEYTIQKNPEWRHRQEIVGKLSTLLGERYMTTYMKTNHKHIDDLEKWITSLTKTQGRI